MATDAENAAAFEVARTRHLGIRWTEAGWMIETPKGQRVHPPGVRTHADPVAGLLAAETAIAAAEARAEATRAERLLEALQPGAYFPRPYTVLVDDGQGGQIPQLRWRIVHADGTPTAINDRSSVIDALAAAAQAIGGNP